jgi:1,4-alpha-glucan branching enzyme
VDIGDKQPYMPAAAVERIREHASHFVQLVRQALQPGFNEAVPPVLCSPFDAELFGHWWFEGVQWLETVARILHEQTMEVALTSCSSYLEEHPRGGFLALHEGSWGAEGSNQVWMNSETAWTYAQLYAAEIACREICTSSNWRDGAMGERVVKQLCRELLLLESSDWQFLITTGAARDYAEARFNGHRSDFEELRALWRSFEQSGDLSVDQMERLSAIEERDNIFADIDPGLWAEGARAVRNAGRPGSPNVSQNGLSPVHSQALITDGSLSEIPKFLLSLDMPPDSMPDGDVDEPV